MNLHLLRLVVFNAANILLRVRFTLEVVWFSFLRLFNIKRRTRLSVNSVELWEPIDGDLFRKAEDHGLTPAPIRVHAASTRRILRRRNHRDCSF